MRYLVKTRMKMGQAEALARAIADGARSAPDRSRATSTFMIWRQHALTRTATRIGSKRVFAIRP